MRSRELPRRGPGRAPNRSSAQSFPTGPFGVERSHRIDAEEFYALLDGLVIDDAKIFNNKLKDWEDYYNYHRPHGGLAGQTPYERLRQITQTPAVTDERQSHTA
jgi:transposase InsO family protein